MDRITESNLASLALAINRATGSPEAEYTRVEKTPEHVCGLRANVGNYHISYAYGGASLCRMVNDAGGTQDVFSCGHVPKRDLYERMRAFLAGLDAARRSAA